VRWNTATVLALALSTAMPAATRAQNFGLGLDTKDNGKPIEIEAEDGIEWQQTNRVYIARGNARATRGQATVFADTLMAFYRPVCSPEAQAAAKAKAARAQSEKTTAAAKPAAEEHACPEAAAAPPKAPAPNGKNGAPNEAVGGNSTEIFRMEADGNVRIATETQTLYGDHAVYDVDQGLLVATGQHLKLETPRDTVTARDDLEWYEEKQLAVARGDAVALREDRRIRGDVLTAEVEKDQNGSSHINRVDAQGNVLVSSLQQIARGDTGVYNVDTGIATLAGRVSLTRGENELRGQYGVVDLRNNVSRLLSAPPSANLTADSGARVSGLLVPRPKPSPPASPKQ
jgi:lipopolysaccharide export system protein LptA